MPEKVYIGILSNGMMVHASQALLAFHLPIWSLDKELPYEFMFWIEAGNSPQPYKRNVIIENFLKTDCDTLVMIDDDMIVTQQLLELLETPEYDIAGPLQYTFRAANLEKGITSPKCLPCAFIVDEEQDGKMKPVFPRGDKPLRVDMVGSGVIAIKRAVLEDSRMLYEDGLSPPAYFQDIYLPNGRRTCGLDVGFCKRATALGYRVKFNWLVEVGHFKRIDLNDVELYAKSEFLLGNKIGEKSNGLEAIQMAESKGRPEAGADRGSGRHDPGSEGVAEVRMDRAARRRAARAAHKAADREGSDRRAARSAAGA